MNPKLGLKVQGLAKGLDLNLSPLGRYRAVCNLRFACVLPQASLKFALLLASHSGAWRNVLHGRAMHMPQATNDSPPYSTTLPESLARLLGFLGQDPTNEGLRNKAIALAIHYQIWDSAHELVKDGLSLAPDNTEYLAHAGFLALKDNQYEQAERYFEAVLNAGIEAPGAKFNLAFAKFQLRKFQESKQLLTEQLLGQAELAAPASLLKARAMHHLGELDDAITCLQRYRLNGPVNDEIDGLASLLMYELDQNTEAAELASSVLARGGRSLEALLARAGASVEWDDFETARADYQAAVTVNPKAGRAWSGLAQVAFRDFELKKALEYVNKAVAEMPDHIGTWHLKAWIHILENDAIQAKAAFDESYKIDHNFGETHGGFAVVHAMNGQVTEAERCIKLAQRLAPLGFAAYYAQMLLLSKAGKDEESKALFSKVMQTMHSGLGVAPQALVEKRLSELAGKNAKTMH